MGARKTQFIKALGSSYCLSIAGVVFGLVSVPLTLHYLPKQEFALWSLMMLATDYLGLIDFGLSSAIGRLLIDHKDQRENGRYGRLVRTGMLVAAAQGGILLLAGQLLAPLAAVLLKIPAELQATFITILRLQVMITAFSFSLRVFRQLLHAHNRNDVSNYGQIVARGAMLGALAIALHFGTGVYSVLIANAVNLLVSAGIMAGFCFRSGYFPKKQEAGEIDWLEFRQLFVFGRDIFIVQLGSQLIVASQSFIISSRLSLEAVAAWAVATKVYFVLCTLLWQIYDYSTPSLSEMMVRQEGAQLERRFFSLLKLSIGLAALMAIIIGTTNRLFISVWTSGKIDWPWYNDLMLAIWLVPLVLVHSGCGFVILTKSLRALRVVFLIEGLVFAVSAYFLVPHTGIWAMIGLSAITSLAISGAYGIYRVRRQFKREAWAIEKDLLAVVVKLAASVGVVAGLLALLTHDTSTVVSLIARWAGLLPVSLFVFWRVCIPPDVRTEIHSLWTVCRGRLPAWFAL